MEKKQFDTRTLSVSLSLSSNGPWPAHPRLAQSLLMGLPAGPIEIRGLETTPKS